jgi:hypothetical protein
MSMRRAVLLFGAGLLLGALAMYFVAGDDAALSTTSSALTSDAAMPATRGSAAKRPETIGFLELVTGSVDTQERAALYTLASAADRATLESLLTQVAELPKLPSRALALELLLTRYGELDAPAAAAFARGLELDAAVVAPLFAAWARRDASAALRALGDLPASTARTVGVALLEVLGNDDLGIIRVLGAAPQIEPDRFRADAAIAKAAVDPEGAVEDALALPPSKSQTALAGIAAAWAKSDPLGALAHVDYIDDNDLRTAFKSSALRTWAATDADAMLAYLVDLSPEEQNDSLRVGAVQAALATLEPERALAAAESLSGELGSMVRRAALMSLARDDALAALRHVDGLPPGGDRESLLNVIAQTYGRTDPAAAVAWAQSTSPELLTSVMIGVARAEPERAMEIMLALPTAAEQQRLAQMLVMNNALSPAQTAAFADRLLAQQGRGNVLPMLASAWAQRAPQAALDWLLANRSPVTARALPQAGMNLARTDPAAAIGYLDRMPVELRASWISAVAEGYAQKDARAAANWVTQYRGEPGYDAAIAAVAARTAQHDPVAAARLFDSVDVAQAPDAPGSARGIAATWARRDPAAAAAWAHAIADRDTAVGAVSSVASQWVARDAAAARNWAMGLPRDAARDAALVQVLGATAGNATADAVLIDAFSSPAAQQQSLNESIRIIAARDVEVARQLADQYISDPGTRQAAERFIEQGARSGLFFRPPPRVAPQR